MTLLELLQLLKHHLKLVVVLPVACAVVMAIYSLLFMGNQYTASTSMYVLMPSTIGDSASTYTDLNASQLMSNDIAALIQSDIVTEDAASAMGLTDLDAFDISIESETNTRVISCIVTGSDPAQAAGVANALASSVSDVAQRVMNVQSVNVIDEATAPTEPSGPNRLLYVAVAFMAGLFAAVAIVVMMDIIDTRVREDEIQELLGVPVIGRVPLIKGGL